MMQGLNVKTGAYKCLHVCVIDSREMHSDSHFIFLKLSSMNFFDKQKKIYIYHRCFIMIVKRNHFFKNDLKKKKKKKQLVLPAPNDKILQKRKP